MTLEERENITGAKTELKYNSIFLSHSTSDKPFVERIKKFLESIGISVFLDNYEITAGESIPSRITFGIYKYDFFCIVYTPKATSSYWVRRELEMAVCRWVDELKMSRSFVIPMLLEECTIWEGIRDLLYIDFRDPVKFYTRCDELMHAVLKPSSSEFFQKQKSFVSSPPEVLAYKNTLKNLMKVDRVHYIPRRLLTSEQLRTFTSFNLTREGETLQSLISKKRLITVLGDAGIGKSTELKMLAYHLSIPESIVIPVCASMNRYVDEPLEQYIPELNQFPDEATILILDGFDEIQSQHKNTAVRRIESYAQSHPLCRIVISARTNLYQSISGFEQFFLSNITSDDARNHVRQQLGCKAKTFENLAWRKDYNSLFTHPFYLNLLIETFRQTGTLPQRRADLFEYFVQAQLEKGLEKYRTTVPHISEQKSQMRQSLERLALVMETMGRNFIEENEFRTIITDDTRRDVLSHSGLMKKAPGDVDIWQFEHNSFQEYLAAKVLSTQPVGEMKKFVAFRPEYQKTKPSWINTISFLTSIISDKAERFGELMGWLTIIEPEVLFKSEPDRISPEIRFNIFKGIFEEYKSKRILLGRDTYTLKDIGQFSDSQESINYMFGILATESDATVLDNAVDVLRFMSVPPSKRAECESLLLSLLEKYEATSHLVSSVLLTLTDLHFNSRSTVDTIVGKIRNAGDSWVRYALYYYLYNSEYLDDYVDVFLEGVRFIRHEVSVSWNGEGEKETRLGDEGYHLKEGLERVKKPDAIHKVLEYFVNHPDDIDKAFLSDSLVNIMENSAAAYKDDPSVFDIAARLFCALVQSHQEKESLAMQSFFDKTGTREAIFKRLYGERQQNKDWFVGVGAVLNEELTEHIAEAFLDGQLTEHDVWILRNFVQWKNQRKGDWFLDAMNEKTGNKFILPRARDYQAERETRFKQDIQLLFDRDAFLNSIHQIYLKERKGEFTKVELRKIQVDHWEDQYFSDLAIRELENLTQMRALSFDEIKKIIINSDWGYFRGTKLYEFMSRNKNVELTQTQVDILKQWCKDSFGKVNFRTTLKKNESGGASGNTLAIVLWYFIKEWDVDCPKNVLLDLLSFDWIDDLQMAGIGYLEDRLEEHEMTQRILENLGAGIEVDSVLKNHLEYCKRKSIAEVVPYAFTTAKNPTLSSDVREAAVNALGIFDVGIQKLRDLVKELKDGFRWNVMKVLKDLDSKYSKSILKEILAEEQPDQKYKAAKMLVEMGDIDGLTYLVSDMKASRRAPQEFHEESILKGIVSKEAIPPLIELLELSYEPDFVDNSFYL